MRFTRRVVAVAAALGLGSAAFGVGSAAQADSSSKCNRNNNSVRKLLECVTLDGVLEHEEALQAIADENKGHAGIRHVRVRRLARLRRRADGTRRLQGHRPAVRLLRYSRKMGPSTLEQTAPGSVTYVEDTDFAPTDHSEPGDVTAPVTPVDIQLGLGNTSTSGCEPGDFTGFPAGNIALIQRGTCTFELKAENAAAAGAVGVAVLQPGQHRGSRPQRDSSRHARQRLHRRHPGAEHSPTPSAPNCRRSPASRCACSPTCRVAPGRRTTSSPSRATAIRTT